MVIGFCLPLFVTSAPSNPNFSNPYPPLANGWDMIGMLHDFFPRPYLALTYVAPEVVLALVLAVATLSTSALALFGQGPRLVARTRSLAAFVSIAVLGWLCVTSLFLNWAGSPDGAAQSPTIALGPGFWLLLLGTVLSAIGVGSASWGALLGAFIGTGIGFFLSFIPVGGHFLYIGASLLGGMLGGWVFLRGHARLQRLPAANEDSDSPPAPKDT
jgi:hypothetical protein